MQNFKWSDSLNVGVKAIDDDHREMMRMLQRIEAAIGEGCLRTCTKLVMDFILLTRAHFTTEEKILMDSNFPKFRQHRVTHGQLLAQAIDTAEFINNATHIDEVEGCLEDLAGFLFHDLIGSDMEFKSYLQECGIAEKESFCPPINHIHE